MFASRGRWFVLVLLLLGCNPLVGDWDELDYCPDTGCTPCSRDEDCVTGSSCCSEALFCSHREDGPTVCSLGCWEPDPPACLCVAKRCRFQ